MSAQAQQSPSVREAGIEIYARLQLQRAIDVAFHAGGGD